MKYIRVLAGAMATLSAANIYAGEAVFYVTEEGVAVQDIAVVVDGNKKLVQQNGFVAFDVTGGEHKVQLTQLDEVLSDFTFSVKAEENAEVKVDIVGDMVKPTVIAYVPGADGKLARGKITGTINTAEKAVKVEGARVSVTGTTLAVMSDKNGYFELDLPLGAYDLTITHPKYAKQDTRNVHVLSSSAVKLDVDMAISSDSVIQELVATGAAIPVDVEQKRDATSIMDSIGSEEIAKTGDSDAAAAVKRVSGVALVGGQYAVVRGLTGRYISSTLNGGTIPSTNPLSRDVALDLFPATVLQGIEINKSYTPDLPGDSTGGSINMVTKGMPEERISKVSLGLGVRTGVTGEDVVSYEGGSTDILGYDDGTREMPAIIDDITAFAQNSYNVCNDPSICISAADAAALGKSLENIYNTDTTKAAPDFDMGLSYGNLLEMESGNIGYYGDVAYKSKWGARQDAEIHDDSGDYTYERSKQNIDFSLYGLLGYADDLANNEILSKTILLRKSDDTTREMDGFDTENTQVKDVTLQWVERSYIGQTFSGKHFLDEQIHQIDWRATLGQSTLNEPDRRNYQFRNQQIFPSTLERRYTEQTEDSSDFSADYTFNWELGSDVTGKLLAGIFLANKERDTELGRLGINQGSLAVTTGDLESLLVPANFDSGDYTVVVRTAATDTYKAKDEMTAYYFSTETEFLSSWILLAGVRFEDARQELTYEFSPNSNDEYKTDEVLPAVVLTWKTTDELQFRAGYSKTVSRPGLTERSLSSQYDPETDEQVFGNNNLVLSTIDNMDFRAEYYFDDVDSVSAGLFTKVIDNPIERTVPDASGSASNGYTFINQDEATVSGIELDIRKLVLDADDFTGYIASNVSLMDSTVTLDGRSIPLEGGITERKLQGQSDVLVNLQFGLDHLPTEQAVTFILNYFDDRIHKVGRARRNEIEVGRATFDVVYKYDLAPELTIGAKIQNLFNEKVSYTIFDDESESYKEGTYINMNMSYAF